MKHAYRGVEVDLRDLRVGLVVRALARMYRWIGGIVDRAIERRLARGSRLPVQQPRAFAAVNVDRKVPALPGEARRAGRSIAGLAAAYGTTGGERAGRYYVKRGQRFANPEGDAVEIVPAARMR